MLMAWLELAGCVLVIGFAGFHLSRYGDAIAEKSGMSRSWVGIALLATVTSLPELATGVSSVTAANAPDIAVGDVLGSCVFNLLILVVLDFVYRTEPVYTRARQGHIVSAGFGTALIGFVGFNVLLYREAGTPALGWVGLYTPVILLLYAFAVRTLYRYEREHVGEFVEREATYAKLTLGGAIGGYAAAALVVVAAGSWLPFVGADLAARMGSSQSFVGTLLVAAVTSTPELVVTIAALKLGALDMAIGNLLGSNLFNIAILGVDDLFFTQGPLLAVASSAHAASSFSAMMMNGLATIGLILRPRSRVFRTVSWISVFLLAVYLLDMLFLYLHGG